MKWTAILAGSTLGLLPPSVSSAAPELTFAFIGPTVLRGPAGSTVKAAYFCTLAHSGPGSHAQGWTIQILSDLSLAMVSLEDTDALSDCRDGTKTAELDPLFDGSATSRVRLAADGSATLSKPTSTVLNLEVEAVVPEGGGYRALRYTNVYVAPNDQRSTQVFQDGVAVQPEARDLEVLFIDTSCAAESVNFGFSAARVSSPEPFDGIIGGESGKGRLLVHVAEGELGATHFFANIVSNLPNAQGVTGWRSRSSPRAWV